MRNTDPERDGLITIEVSEDRLGNAAIVGNTVEFYASRSDQDLFGDTVSGGGADKTSVLLIRYLCHTRL